MARKRQNQTPQRTEPQPGDQHAGSSRPLARTFFIRLAVAVIAPLLVFAILEGGLRLANYGHPTGFFAARKTADGREILVENEQFGWTFFGPALARVPYSITLASPKPERTCRVFVFGESAAYGDPLPAFGLCRLLEAQLSLRYPGTRFEVVNAAMTAINSHVILPIARDCARQDGDLWVIYMGNNEVVGPYGSGTVFGRQAPPLPVVRASIALKQSRLGQLFESALRGKTSGEDSEWGGMTMFLKNQVAQDDPRMERVYSHFAKNLRDIIATATSQGTKVILSTMACNLADCPPFGSMHQPGLSDSQLAEWDQLVKSAATAEAAGKYQEAAGSLRSAAKIDSHYAELHYRLGRCCLALGLEAEAKNEFSAARDLDTLRFRADSRINNAIRRTAAEHPGVALADAEQELAHHSPHDLCGADLFYEHVHLTFAGNYWLARTIADQAAALLPAEVTRSGNTNWPSMTECAERLAWTDWNRNEAARDILLRISDPPFSTQITHDEQVNALRAVIEKTSGPQIIRQALTECKIAARAMTNDWQLQENYARLAKKMNDLESATDCWRKINDLMPAHPAFHHQLGQSFNYRKLPQDAVHEFQTALSLKPEYPEAVVGIGVSLIQQGKPADAIKEYERALKMKPNSLDAQMNLAMALESMGRTAEAGKLYAIAVKCKPLNAEALVSLGQVCVRQGWTNLAIEKFSAAVRIDPGDGRAHFLLGGLLVMAGHRNDAFEHFQQAVKLMPGMAEAHLGLGIELGTRGEHAEAADQFADAVRLNPNLLEARLNLGMALNHLGKQEESLQEFRQALRLDPQNQVARSFVERLGKN